MAKLTRVFQKIFSGEAPLAQVGQFGSFAENAPMKTKDPSVIQSLANWTTGWYSAVRGAYSPTIQDMNGVLLVLSYQLAYLFQQGIAEWDSATSYYVNSVVCVAGVDYISLQNDNLNHAVTDPAWWAARGTNIRTISLTSQELLPTDVTVLFASPDAPMGMDFMLPLAASFKGKKLYLKNIGTGLCGGYPQGASKIDGADTIDISTPMKSVILISDGSNWFTF